MSKYQHKECYNATQHFLGLDTYRNDLTLLLIDIKFFINIKLFITSVIFEISHNKMSTENLHVNITALHY